LAGPSLHSFNVALLAGFAAHLRCETTLNRVRGGLWSIGRCCGFDISGCHASSGTTAECATEARAFRWGMPDGVGPGRMNLCFRTAEETGPDLGGTGAKGERGCNASAVGNASRRHNRHGNCVHYGREE
jgi:hypothetical protein